MAPARPADTARGPDAGASAGSSPNDSAIAPGGSGTTSIVLSGPDMARTIDRIAHQILERVGDRNVVLLGIPTRGVFLARRLAARVQTFSGRPCPAGSLDITLYRDDLRRRPPLALQETRLPDGGVDDATVILVDDVLYSGRTVRAALDALRDHGRPAVVQLAVLIDRGHRQLPIRADYVGKNIPTALADDVVVRLDEIDDADSVSVVRA